MTSLSSVTLRELARFCLDITKLTGTAAFITPYFTAINIKPYVTISMATVAMTFFIIGMNLHRITDKLEKEEREAGKDNEEKPNLVENKERNKNRQRRKTRD